MDMVKNTLDRHQKAWVYLALAAGISGYSTGTVINDSPFIAILVTLNAIVVTYACSRIEFRTINRDYKQASGKVLSPLQAYIYLKAERHWMAVAGVLLVIGFLFAYFAGTSAFSVVTTAVFWLALSALMWKLYADAVYTSFLKQ